MTKKILGMMLVLLLSVGSANALASVGILGGSYTMGGTTAMGYGLNVEAPILPIPMLTSRIEAIYVSGTNYSLVPILITGSYKPPLMPVYFGAGAGLVLYSRSDVSITVPTVLNSNVFVGYEQNFMPMSSYFVQLGYEIMRVDYTVGAASVTADFSGISIKGGVRVGI